MLSLHTKIEDIPRIGSAYQKRLKKMGIHTIADLLYHFPSRYEDFSDVIEIAKAKKQLSQNVCVQGEIIEIESANTPRKFMNITQITIQDNSGEIKALWFNQPYLLKSLKEGQFICLAGKVALGKEGIYLSNPIHEFITEDVENNELTHTGRIIPIYPETRGITSRWLRYIIKPILTILENQIPESLPNDILKKYKFLPINEAIWQVHFPESFEYADAAKARFSFEELFLIQLSVLKEKARLQLKKAPAFPLNADLMKQFTDSLPFQLTDSQKVSAFQILKDLEKPVPMSRLLQGDVGSGKTVVATMAALNVAKHKYQTAFMGPTEILAKQHFKTISKLLENFDVSIGLLTSKNYRIAKQKDISDVSRKSILGDLENGQLDIIIGTHSLIQKGVEFKNLGLAIVDEQHRFGVEQRAKLFDFAKLTPHLLSMTATPIPRTLALTVYGDLDVSLISEMPKNRKKIKTIIVEPSQRKQAYEFIEKEVKQGRGVFVICPKIESKSSKIEARINETTTMSSNFIPQNYAPTNNFASLLQNDVKAVKEEYERLSKEIFPDLRITMLHGKMKPEEKERIMLDFQKGELDILVSTSVVEVGVDVPRATVMMIEGAERFGLAQLHQFRGRVGRSNLQSYCFLFTTSPDQLNRKRLKAMVELDSGFKLAEKDLEIRGPGSLYGSTQWGIPDFAMEGLFNIFLVEKTRSSAKELLEKDPELKDYPILKEKLKLLQKKIHFE